MPPPTVKKMKLRRLDKDQPGTEVGRGIAMGNVERSLADERGVRGRGGMMR